MKYLYNTGQTGPALKANERSLDHPIPQVNALTPNYDEGLAWINNLRAVVKC